MGGRGWRHRLVSWLLTVGDGVVRRHPANNSRSLFELAPNGPLMLLRSGELDRERRMATKLRTVDLQALLARPGSVVVFSCKRLKPPIVVPAALLANALASRLRNGAAQASIHVHVEPPTIRLVEGALDLAPFLGQTHLTRLIPKARRTRPARGSHELWHAKAAALGQRCGFNVHVPVNNRPGVLAAAPRGITLGACDSLPPDARGLPRIQQTDVALSEPGERMPRLLIEVEHGGDITCALDRHAHVMAGLLERKETARPRFVILAEASRRREFERKLLPMPLYSRIDLTQHCEFWSYADLDATLAGLHAGLPAGGLPIRLQ